MATISLIIVINSTLQIILPLNTENLKLKVLVEAVIRYIIKFVIPYPVMVTLNISYFAIEAVEKKSWFK